MPVEDELPEPEATAPAGQPLWLQITAFALAILGLVIFAGLTMFDFQRLRRSKDMDSAPLIAASIFLDALNVFLFFLRIFGNSNN